MSSIEFLVGFKGRVGILSGICGQCGFLSLFAGQGRHNLGCLWAMWVICSLWGAGVQCGILALLGGVEWAYYRVFVHRLGSLSVLGMGEHMTRYLEVYWHILW